jgi:hypothetical protein
MTCNSKSDAHGLPAQVQIQKHVLKSPACLAAPTHKLYPLHRRTGTSPNESPVALSIGFIVFLLVCDKVREREAVVRRDEIDAVDGKPVSPPLAAPTIAPPVVLSRWQGVDIRRTADCTGKSACPRSLRPLSARVQVGTSRIWLTLLIFSLSLLFLGLFFVYL